MNKVPEYEITIHAGVDYAIDFAYEDDNDNVVSAEGWTIEAQLRDYKEAANAFEFECSSDEEGFHLRMDRETTGQINFKNGVYDVFITTPDGSIRDKLIMGTALIYTPEVTR